MSIYLYNLVPMLTGLFLAMALMFKLYKRSVSSFVAIVGLFIISNLMHHGYVNHGLVTIAILGGGLLIRGMLKPDNDKWVYFPHDITHDRRTVDKVKL